MLHAYPTQLAAYVRNGWGEDADRLPSFSALEAVLSTAYQASLLADELRPVTFRLIFSGPEPFPDDEGPPQGLHRLRFVESRPFTADELRRLSPAAKFHRALIGVESRGGRLSIWGMLQSGPRWLQSARGGQAGAPSIATPSLVVRVHGPGRLAVAKGDVTLAELRGGTVTGPSLDVFESTWLPRKFAAMREEIFALHERERAENGKDWRPLAPDVVRRVSQQMVKRVLATMREAHHGGTLLFLPPDCATAHRSPYLTLKYGFFDEEPRRRYRTLILRVMRALAQPDTAAADGAASEPPTGGTLAALDEAVFELGHLIAALADVDGAVVMTKRFELLGFGAEIAGHLPEVHQVHRAIDLEGRERATETIYGVGTRHRSAYRLCAAVPDAVAIVVSQDGAVRFATSLEDGEIGYWEHTSSGSVDV